MPDADTAYSSPSSRAAAAALADAAEHVPTPGEQAANRAVNETVVPKLFKGRLRPLYPLYRSFELWSDADGLRMSAAMAFYGMFSIAPLLLVLVAVLGYVVDREVLQTSLIHQVESLVGAKGAEVVQAAIASAQQPGEGLFASVLAFVLLVVGATGVFAELQSALERLWTQGTGTAAVDAWWHSATLRLRGIAYVLAFGFLMLVSLVIASAVNLLQTWAGSRYEMETALIVLNQLLSLAITTALFVALMRMSAGPQPRLRYLIAGGAVGALLFGVGKYALAWYLSTAAVVSAYGAAGSLVVLLMWIYFASAVLLYGASCARVLAERQGDFAAAATPPPAAAVTAVQGEVRRAIGADEGTVGTAAAAAVLSDMTGAPSGSGAPPAPGSAAAASGAVARAAQA
ncbi:YihY/virulence factor BrkB family protein, partial [Ottowia flava]